MEDKWEKATVTKEALNDSALEESFTFSVTRDNNKKHELIFVRT